MNLIELLLSHPAAIGVVTVIVTSAGLCVTSWLSGEREDVGTDLYRSCFLINIERSRACWFYQGWSESRLSWMGRAS